MNIDQRIKAVLFDIAKEIKVHKIDEDNMVIEMEYDRYTLQIKAILEDYVKVPKDI
jgi:hypothetical protein